MTSPYLSELFSTYATGPVVKFSSKEQKGALGEQLYNIVYDRMHAAADEFKVDHHRQQMEKEGWSVDAELTYLKELDLAHRKLINAHSELSRFTDEPQSNTQKYMGNTIKHETIGNDVVFDRSLSGTIGIMRGECQAIKNGYGSKQLMVLGTLGAIEEEINRIKKHGIEGTLEGMARFEADFAKLKAECYYKDATDPLEKNEIADKIMSFIQTQSSPAAKQCMNHLSICQDSFNDAFKSVLKEAELYDIYKDMYEPARRKFNIPADMRRRFELAELKQKDPVEYLKRLEAEAKKTGDYSRFVEMLSEFKRDDLLNGDKEEKYDEYLNSLVQDYDT
ncbi:MAG: hypothetical protein IJM75_06765 [Ruminococcus sp.]|nr:hypothetical protein [Ruminococcus sp.]